MDPLICSGVQTYLTQTNHGLLVQSRLQKSWNVDNSCLSIATGGWHHHQPFAEECSCVGGHDTFLGLGLLHLNLLVVDGVVV